MKFCGKCHKMKVKRVTNPNDLTRFCHCDPNGSVLLNESVISRMRAMASGVDVRSCRRETMRNIRKLDEQDPVE